MQQNKQWLKFRHKVVTKLLRPILGAFTRVRYGIKVEKFDQQGDRPYLIIMNHQTAFDQFFVGMTFNRPVYYVASEDLFSMGWISRLIQYLVEPIPIKKQTLDLQAVKNCIKVAREGGSIALAPEGNRTFHGRTLYMKPGIASLVKKLGLPLAIFRIEGGYGVHPRWSDVVRRGKMRSFVSRVVEPEEYAAMTNEELFHLIEQELWVDEGCVTGSFRHRKNAEFLERAMYVCPWCGLSTFESHGDTIHCTKCGRKIRHLSTKELQGVDCEFPHRFVAQWYDWQCSYINNTDLLALTEEPVYTETVRLSLVTPNKNKTLLNKAAAVALYGDRITVDDRVMPFEEISSVVVLGKNKLNIYVGKELLQMKGSKRFNALKYVNFFHRYKNEMAGNDNEFLGL
ncbi:MAG: 1-acyl-sn-glycerol-3-phosphate acyltransferase [Oscillospiraceae bacterium]|nr:1-acyl-sn-glycerol-3-phosphate acyltransferase [Oscillospiraceae bacterium]